MNCKCYWHNVSILLSSYLRPNIHAIWHCIMRKNYFFIICILNYSIFYVLFYQGFCNYANIFFALVTFSAQFYNKSIVWGSCFILCLIPTNHIFITKYWQVLFSVNCGKNVMKMWWPQSLHNSLWKEFLSQSHNFVMKMWQHLLKNNEDKTFIPQSLSYVTEIWRNFFKKVARNCDDFVMEM